MYHICEQIGIGSTSSVHALKKQQLNDEDSNQYVAKIFKNKQLFELETNKIEQLNRRMQRILKMRKFIKVQF